VAAGATRGAGGRLTPKRWGRIKEVFGAARERPESQRSDFLDTACGGDAELRAEVAALLAEGDGDSLLSPAAGLLGGREYRPGDTIGQYRVEGKLGEGGMGVVYKARDTRLNRTVAIKLSTAQFSGRFEREARAVAALNHPHICTLYEVGPDYLVMEYVEGKPLTGPLSQAEVMRLAGQLLDALAAAHAKGIVHRDLKPANILVTKVGVKVLDFGLAKMPAGAASAEARTETATQDGAILGTLQYMSPEQVQGKEVDARSDIFSFGLVLYEMLTGKRAFEAENSASVIAAILEREAPSVGEIAPESLDWLLGRCLAKDPDERWQAARDLRAFLERCSEGGTFGARPDVGVLRTIGWIAAGVLAILLALLAFVRFREAPQAHVRLAQFVVEPPAGAEFVSSSSAASVSPDGRYLVFGAYTGADSSLWLRPIDSLNARMLPGTENGRAPFWSPDSKSIGFLSGGKLKRTDIAGGAPQALCDATVAGTGGTWNRAGIILFGQGAGLLRVPASGGAPQIVTQPDSRRKEGAHSEPQFLPDGNRFLYFIGSADADVRGIYAGSLDHPGDRLRILATDHKASYVPPADGRSGFLLWIREQSLVAQPFDEGHLRLEGEATPVAENVGQSTSANAAFFTSDTGLLVYRSGVRPQMRKLVWMSRDGKTQGEAGKEEYYGQFRLSPDGTRLAVTILDGNANADIWVLDLGRAIMSRLTFTPKPRYNPAWSPDGRQIAYDSDQTGVRQLYRKEANSEGQEEQLTRGPDHKGLSDWSPDGRYLLYQDLNPQTGFDLGVLTLAGEREPHVLKTPFSKFTAKFSPDGNSIAYISHESGRDEAYLRAFPVSGGQWQVSSQGGSSPRWRADGKELYYLEPASNSLMATGVHIVGGSFQTDAPRKLFAVPGGGSYDVTADGQRFIVFEDVNAANGPVPLTVVLNWQAGLQK
jgi:Tol biopolymer transport system component/tRNA A-37 threonylcarbamoyl transferase component Bud32